MIWHRVNQRRTSPCVSRSDKRPNEAYLMLPSDMVPEERVSIYTDGRGRIALEFCIDGDYAVRRTSGTSSTMRVNIPKQLAKLIPVGLHDVELKRSSDGWLILDPQTLA